MPSKKQRRKDRKNTYKLIDDAWEALESGHAALADRLAKRAIDQGAMNPRVWCDRARILEQLGEPREAERAYRAAIALAPSYADAIAGLARLVGAEGSTKEGAEHESANDEVDDAPATMDRTAHLDWAEVGDELLQRGIARLPRLLDEGACQSLREMWNAPERFEHEVTMDGGRGLVAYRFFRRPLPDVIQALREEVFARAAIIANQWNERLGEEDRYPTSLAAFLARCGRAGQARTTPILLRYPEGGFNGFHRDVHGDVAFPLQLAVTLGPEPGGGDLLLLDERPGRRRVRALRTEPGDGALFCARARMVRIAGLYGLQPVLHAVGVVTAKERYAVGIPFHEYLGG